MPRKDLSADSNLDDFRTVPGSEMAGDDEVAVEILGNGCVKVTNRKNRAVVVVHATLVGLMAHSEGRESMTNVTEAFTRKFEFLVMDTELMK